MEKSAACVHTNPKLCRMISSVWRSVVCALYRRIGWTRARFLVRKIAPHLVGKTLLDLGAGTGHTAVLLQTKHKMNVSMLDVAPHKGAFGQRFVGQPIAAHLAAKHNIARVRYDGKRVPFKDNSFDVVLVAFVLHHCDSPELVVREAARVAKYRVVVLEDVNGERRSSRFERFLDALFNLELFHPHQERTRSQWLELFKSCDLEMREEERWTWKIAGLGVGQTLWVLEERVNS